MSQKNRHIMKKMQFFLLATLSCLGLLLGCNPADKNEGEDQNQQDLKAISASVPVTENWIFDKRPSITIHMENPNSVAMDAEVRVNFSTEFKEDVTLVEKTVKVPANGTEDVTVSTKMDLKPGFYKANCFVNKKSARRFCFGISPFEIVSAPDKQPDYDQFWETALSQLPVLDNSNVVLTEIPTKSTSSCKMYMVEFPSVPDGLDGEPVIVRGYYLEPADGQPHPVIMHFQGYDTQPNYPKIFCPAANGGDYAEFYLSHRGQYINARPASKRDDGIERDFENIYGDWFAFNFGNRDGYYYRGAFMDTVQAVRFMATRTTSDMKNLFAEGSSQGGALCYAAAALSDIPFVAIAPNVAFLGDFPDYFRIVGWPGDTAKNNQGSMTDKEMYAFLSYFDTKNLATRISCAVYATIGLQDGTCPPHTNIAPFNNLNSTDKEMHFYPEMTHSYPPSWTSTIMKYFKARTK